MLWGPDCVVVFSKADIFRRFWSWNCWLVTESSEECCMMRRGGVVWCCGYGCMTEGDVGLSSLKSL